MGAAAVAICFAAAILALLGGRLGLRLAVWLLAILLMLSACAFEPEGAYPYDPPASYRAVWAEAEGCTGRTRDFDAFRFFLVPGRTFEHDGTDVAGVRQGGRIYIAEAWHLHPMVVKHEMIHAILGRDGHPARPFEDPCKATWRTYDGTGEALAE